MNYEKIIVELLGRIQNLEEKVDILMAEKDIDKKPITMGEIRQYIINQKQIAKDKGRDTLVLIARDIHNDLNLKSRFPMVCNAMRQCMDENDRIIFQPPKGYSSTLEIEYKL